MSSLATSIRNHVAPTGPIVKTLTVLYVVWIIFVIGYVANHYGATSVHGTQLIGNFWVNDALSIGAIAFFAFISTLQDNQYGILPFFLRKKALQAFLAKLDERQLDARRRIFEKSYTLLGSLMLLAAFTLPTWFAQGISNEGAFILAFNMFIFVMGLPSLVAVWDKSPFNQPLS